MRVDLSVAPDRLEKNQIIERPGPDKMWPKSDILAHYDNQGNDFGSCYFDNRSFSLQDYEFIPFAA